ncbi:MAG: UDP-N-acetylmuramate dehydrogenase [Minisyncoccia bacterium]
MTVEENISLASLTTLRAGGNAHTLVRCRSEEEVREALAYATSKGMSFYVLGEGSNVLAAPQGFAGVVVRMETKELSFVDEGTSVLMTGDAGISWDTCVHEAARRELWGIENLAGIPGTLGAAPVQNIGAYGTELSQVLHQVEVLDTTRGTLESFSLKDCELGYRDSRFKHDRTLVILRVTVRLRKEGHARTDYSDLKAAVAAGADVSTPAHVGDAVRSIRARKFPDLAEYGTAGSFFKNPIVTDEVFGQLKDRYGSVPSFPHVSGIKIPLAFILDHILNLRGFRMHRAFLFGAQPLVLVLEPGGTSEDIEALAREVEQRVHDATGIRIEREVRSMPTR